MTASRWMAAAVAATLIAGPLLAQQPNGSGGIGFLQAESGRPAASSGANVWMTSHGSEATLLPSRLTRGPLPEPAPQAVDHSDAYYTRLNIHRYGSYAMLPLFLGEYLLGNELLNGSDPADWVKPTHVVVAGALGAVFAVNTVTGVWNLIEAKDDPGATKRWLHVALMLGADAAMVYTASLAEGDDDRFGGDDGLEKHRDWALISMSGATAGTLLMWLWPD